MVITILIAEDAKRDEAIPFAKENAQIAIYDLTNQKESVCVSEKKKTIFHYTLYFKFNETENAKTDSTPYRRKNRGYTLSIHQKQTRRTNYFEVVYFPYGY